MKVKQTLNNSVSAFDFTFDLSDGAYMSKILSLYNIQNIYLCIYDLHIETELLISSLKKNNVKCFQVLNSNKKKDIHDVVMCLCIQNIIPLFLLFKNKYSEIVVWNCYAEWNEFVKDQQTTDDFLTIKKTNFETNLNPSFYLKFNPYDKNSVEIICDLLFDNCLLINKEDLIKILIG